MTTLITPICIADGPTLTGTAAASCVPVACPLMLLAGYWQPGMRWRLTLAGKLSSSILDPRGLVNQLPGTARFDLRFGAQVVWDSLPITLNASGAYSNVPWRLDVELVCRSVGGGNTAVLLGTGIFTCADLDGASTAPPAAGGSIVVPVASAPAVGGVFDAGARLGVDVMFSQTASTGSLTVSHYAIEEV